MTESDVLQQSRAAYKQWAVQWREQARAHAKFQMKSLLDFENSGVGKAVLLVANGYSFEENIETIKEHQANVDVICCDKTLGHLLDHGITPKICIVCDANVNFEAYMEKWQDKLQDTILFQNVCANPKWAEKGNWKDRYFFVNKDVLKSEQEFCALSGCSNIIPAGTNVSNAMLVMITQSDNSGKRNFFGYDKILLIGYDYCWLHEHSYYAFNKTGGGKASYMKHIYCNANDGSFAYTSGNLAFSAQWLEKYVKTFNLPVVVGSKKTILFGLKTGELQEHMRYSYKQEHAEEMQKAVRSLRELNKVRSVLEKQISGIGREHWLSFLGSV